MPSRSTFSPCVPYPGDAVSTPSHTLLYPFLPRFPLRSACGELRRPGEASASSARAGRMAGQELRSALQAALRPQLVSHRPLEDGDAALRQQLVAQGGSDA